MDRESALSTAATPTLSWTVTPETNRWLHLLAYGLMAPLGAVALILVGGAVAVAAASVREGAWAVVLALGAVAVVALARPPVLAALLSEEASLGHEDWQPSRLGVALASLGCAVAMLLAFQHSPAAAGAVAALTFAAALVGMALSTDAEIDREAMVLATKVGPSVSLNALSGVRSVAVGSVVIYWLAYARGAGSLRAPRVLTIPREQATEVREVLDAGVDADSGADPAGRAERAVVTLVGLGVLATGPALFLLIGDAAADGLLVIGYAGVFSLVFAAPMLWYAWKG
ncbi:hypothetical protein [Halolamina salifodinae]|uniref:Uncharacterized protein n=1 Tax=Halolamina salifodinae TaxID=1202767 RepID=A0A8T4GU45_9EURY|nr:hypothetical protein [Halolamina salifodinae]MBP1986396.1 hypothetical protein [Halolamina salifodinae]